jgi:hypothetical protein
MDFASSSGGRLIDWDDGHVPETLDETTAPTKLVEYPEFFQDARVCVFDNVVDEHLVDALYNVTAAHREERKPWGTYVTKSQIQELWEQGSEEDTHAVSNHCDYNDNKDHLALLAAAAFFEHAMTTTKVPSQHYSSPASSFRPLLSPQQFDQRVHGVAIWALPASQGSSVPYHLDYAEQVRYASNVIVPPFLAGTLQCSRSALVGGDFCVSLEGLSHYEKHGYKSKKQVILEDTNNNNMLVIPYHYNRLTMHSGHLPHASTRVETIQNPQQQRVIVGFNVFGHDVGQLVQDCPEHSPAFHDMIQRLRKEHTNSKNTTFSLETIRAHPALAQRLVLAKRAKIKAELLQAQEELDERVCHYLQRRRQDPPNETTTIPTIIADLVSEFARSDGSWPRSDDVYAHILLRWKQGKLWNVLEEKSKDDDEKDAPNTGSAGIAKPKNNGIIIDEQCRVVLL